MAGDEVRHRRQFGRRHFEAGQRQDAGHLFADLDERGGIYGRRVELVHAAIPASQTCMNCHSLVKTDSPPTPESKNSKGAAESTNPNQSRLS